MTELEKMQRAKQYIEKLANGIDPITNMEVPNDSVLNNVRLSRCFFYVADILSQVIAHGGRIGRAAANKKLPFTLEWDMVRHIPVSDEPVYISRITEKINSLIDNEKIQGLRPVTITKWLVEKGYLKEETSADGKKRKLPTEKGMQIGITSEIHHGQYGSYMALFYSQEAQRFLLDNLKEIVEASNCG